MMKAAVRRNYVSPKGIQIENIETPVPKDNEVLIKVYATTVNRTDCAVLKGKPYVMRLFTGIFKPKSIVPGTDFSGEVISIGEKVSEFKVNDKVMGFKDDGLLSQAEFMAFPEKGNMIKISDEIDLKKAVASIEGAHYAYNFIKKLNISEDQKILINGVSGAIGSAMIQLVGLKNKNISAVCDTKNIELAKSLGAVKVFDYLKEDFTKDSEKYDLVLDAVGKSSFKKCKKILKKKGAYISSELGPNGENPFLAISTSIFGGKKVYFPFPTDIKGSLNYMHNLLIEGKYNPVIEKEYPLEGISEAYTYVDSGQKTGNIILNIHEK